MPAIRPEDLGFNPLLSDAALRRLALDMNKGTKKMSKQDAEKDNRELKSLLEKEQQKMREYEERCKKAKGIV
jgi:hypothetical protein